MKIGKKVKYVVPEDIEVSELYAEREFNDEQIAKAAERLSTEQKIQPLLIQKKNKGKYELVAGHRRLMVAKQAGIDRIPCVIFKDTDEMKATMQKLDFIHDVGEHVILQHPKAHAHYRKLKAEYLQRELSPELETEKAWKDFVRESLLKALKAMLFKLFGWKHKDALLNALFKELQRYEGFESRLESIVNDFSQESFKVSEIDQYAQELIEYLVQLLEYEAEDPLTWVSKVAVNLKVSPHADAGLSDGEANDIFEMAENTLLAVYKRHVRNTLTQDANRFFLTIKSVVKKGISEKHSVIDSKQCGFCDAFCSGLADLLRANKGANLTAIMKTNEFANLCRRDYQVRLNVQLKRMHKMIMQAEKGEVDVDDAYMENLIDKKDLLDGIYQGFQLKASETESFAKDEAEMKETFCYQMGYMRTKQRKLSHYLGYFSEKAYSDQSIRSDMQVIFHRKLMELRRGLKVHYHYADTMPIQATSVSELLGTLLFMHRSYKHFLKDRIADKPIFFKKRMKFGTIQRYLEKDRAINLNDGVHEFAFMIQLDRLGHVVTNLEVLTTGRFRYHVNQFQAYSKALTKNEKAQLRDDDEEEGNDKKSSFYRMITEIAKRGSRVPRDGRLDQTVATWMRKVVRLQVVQEDEHFSAEIVTDVNRLLRIYTFLMFYIEGLRNPGAFVVHPMVLKELIDQPLKKLERYITDGRFIMTPPGSKEEGIRLHQTFHPPLKLHVEKASNSGTDEKEAMHGFKFFERADGSMADREIEVFDSAKEKPVALEQKIKDQFGL